MPRMFHLTVERTICTAHGAGRGLHGHNWRVSATISAPGLDPRGHVLAPRAFETLLWEVVEPLDHRRLEDLPMSSEVPPTAMGVALFVGTALAPRLDPTLRLSRVDVYDGTVTSSWTPDSSLDRTPAVGGGSGTEPRETGS